MIRNVLPLVAAFAAGLAGAGARAEMPTAPGEIRLICGGGFTGAYGGIVAKPDGRIVALGNARLRPGPEEETPRAVVPEIVRRWNRLLDQARFETLPRGTPGNMSCTLTRRRHGTNVTVYVEGQTAPAARVPAVRRVFNELEAFQRSRPSR